jgi:hypothetical protein
MTPPVLSHGVLRKFVHAAADTSLHHACGANVLAANQAGTVRLLKCRSCDGRSWPRIDR